MIHLTAQVGDHFVKKKCHFGKEKEEEEIKQGLMQKPARIAM